MDAMHANEFGGDPFPPHKPESRRMAAAGDPKPGSVEEEDSELDDTKAYDLGGSD